jgi:hypothetical protein
MLSAANHDQGYITQSIAVGLAILPTVESISNVFPLNQEEVKWQLQFYIEKN